MRLLSAFGLAISSDIALPGLAAAADPSWPRLHVRMTSQEDVDRLWSGADRLLWVGKFPDGCDVTTHAGRDADHLIAYGDRALFHISAEADVLTGAAVSGESLAWQRFLLDTCLWTACLLNGYEALHASAVEADGRLVGFVAGTGGGKSTLCLEFLRSGASLFCDDILALGRTGEGVYGFPGPRVMNIAAGADGLGIGARRLAMFEDEAWVSLPGSSPDPLPLDSLVLLHRAPGEALRVRKLGPTALDLLPAAIGVSITGHRRTRFELFSDVAVQAATYEVRADPAVSPAELRAAIGAALGL